MIKAIIFDFDGVILESTHIKTKAFETLYLPYGYDVVKKVIEHHIYHGGISRTEKIKHYHKSFLRKPLNQSQLDELCKQFENLVYQKVIESNFVRGAYEFLNMNYSNYLFFISSGTPEQELIKIINQKKINSFFLEIKGSPESKVKHIKRFLRNYKLKPYEVAFVGDATTDKYAALRTNLFFIARITQESLLTNETWKINDLSELNSILLKINQNNEK